MCLGVRFINVFREMKLSPPCGNSLGKAAESSEKDALFKPAVYVLWNSEYLLGITNAKNRGTSKKGYNDRE